MSWSGATDSRGRTELLRAQVHLWGDWADESLYFLEVYRRFALRENRGYWAGHVCAADPAWLAAIARPIVPATMMKQLKAQGMGRKSLVQVLAELDQHLQMLNVLLYERDWLVGEQIRWPTLPWQCSYRQLLPHHRVSRHCWLTLMCSRG